MALRKQILHKLLCMMVALSSCCVVGCGSEEPSGAVVKSYGDKSFAHDASLPVLSVDDSVIDYYEDGEWDIYKSFDGLCKTVTRVGDDYEVDASVDKNSNIMVRIYGKDQNGVDLAGELRLIDKKKIYLKVSSNEMSKDTYFVSDIDIDDTTIPITTYCEVFALAKSMGDQSITRDHIKVVYNCRTKFNGHEVDDVTVSYYDSVNYTYVLFVDPKTHKVLHISSSIISGDDTTDLIYDDDQTITAFTTSDFANSTNKEATVISDTTMTQLFDAICFGIVNKDVESVVTENAGE